MLGKLIVLPNFMHEESSPQFFSDEVREAVALLDGCVVEGEKKARAFLKHFNFNQVPSFRELPLYSYNEHERDLKPILEQLRAGKTLGLLSEAGLACLADPGSELIYRARKEGIGVKIVGVQSSLIYGLISSGLAQQAFYFAGYLPKEIPAIKERLKKLEKFSLAEKSTIVFIETPYRNELVLKQLLETLSPQAELAYCQNLGAPSERVYMQSIGKFDIGQTKVDKSPAVFVFRAVC